MLRYVKSEVAERLGGILSRPYVRVQRNHSPYCIEKFLAKCIPLSLFFRINLRLKISPVSPLPLSDQSFPQHHQHSTIYELGIL